MLTEDNIELAELTAFNLKKHGFVTDIAHSGEETLCLLEGNGEYDAIILDLILPDVDGVRLLKDIKSMAPMVPVLALTAKDSEKDKVSGFQAGFDDYLTKPFSHHELAARLRVLCRWHLYQPTKKIKIGSLHINLETQTVARDGRQVKLTLNEFRVLSFLAKNKGKRVSIGELLESVWDRNSTNGSGKVITTVSRLRKKIGDYQKKIIVTRQGGYSVGDN